MLQYSCMPQSDEAQPKTELETLEFKVQLNNINLLYLGCAVLVLLDLSYLSRFWTQVRRLLEPILTLFSSLHAWVLTTAPVSPLCMHACQVC